MKDLVTEWLDNSFFQAYVLGAAYCSKQWAAGGLPQKDKDKLKSLLERRPEVIDEMLAWEKSWSDMGIPG